ncbi:ABC transporter ATP-binding protein/permease [Gordonia alkanivorans]|uniref:ABC transporter ATP-binding protein/permease n=1 Tax=Gordonia alkanivorans TaxID=84096 RepID=UPI000FDF427F|nr:ABC transporter ATP-binding protein/permease [Gordonia alkanivorans]AZZ82682.1 multidrug ABC transporter ATP-binding protein [Gordonia alkanivorans]MDJ0029462.1 ABC transporter ATP-binding protein/permease [Gordonia alkanivorans]
MEYSIDWGNEVWASLKWLAIAFGISAVAMLVIGFLLARFSRWGRPLWRVIGGFFTEPGTRLKAWGLAALLTVLALLGVRITVLFSYFSNDLFTGLQTAAEGLGAGGPQGAEMLQMGKDAFWHSMAVFGILATVHVVRTMIEIYVGAAFEINLRRWMTGGAAADWMDGRAFYRNRFVDLSSGLMRRKWFRRTSEPSQKPTDIHPGVDNPDQRIQADITNVASVGSSLLWGGGGSSTNGVLTAVASIASFSKILWDLSGPVTLLGVEIPRMMMWLVLVYVLVTSVVAFAIGRPLIRLNFWQERLTANFRYALVRVRDGAENIAFYRGERVEHNGLMSRFAAVIKNYWQIIHVQMAFVGWNFSVSQLAVVFPYLVQIPRFFDGQIKLGDMQQTASAFGEMHDALSFFRTAYDDFTGLRASIIRLDGLADADVKSRAMPEITTVDRDRAVRLADISVKTPTGDELIRALNISLDPGDALVVKGRSGSGKTTLLRGLAGLWPFIDGEFSRPPDAHTLFLSQMPYIPLGDLRTAVAYPALPDDVGDEAIKQALEQVFLPHLTGRLYDEEDWAKVLSPGEQQRVAFARILLTKPQAVFMDEATSAVDEGLEYALYQLVRTELPDTILVSVSHRSTTDQHHTEVLELTGGGAWTLSSIDSSPSLDKRS